MKNCERIAKDLAFKVGQYERGEISAKSLYYSVHILSNKDCAHCIYRHSNCRNDPRINCDEGIETWLDNEVTI